MASGTVSDVFIYFALLELMYVCNVKCRTVGSKDSTSFVCSSLFFTRDVDGAIVRPLPRAKRMLSEATCLPHLVQVLSSTRKKYSTNSQGKSMLAIFFLTGEINFNVFGRLLE